MAGAELPSIRYRADRGFHRELRRRVADHFRESGLSARADAVMRRKTAILVAWFLASYVGLVFLASSLWIAIPVALSLSLAIAGIGFSIQHDANHGAYSHRRSVNRLLGVSLDLVGASSYVWKWKHNVVHHSHPNVADADADIDLGLAARLAPDQPLRGWHRLQCFYIWPLYAGAYLRWHGFEDFRHVLAGKIGARAFPRPRGRSLAIFLAGKAIFCGWALVLPALVRPLRLVAPFYVGCSLVVGLVIAHVIQLGHCTEGVAFPRIGDAEHEWAVLQIRTASDYARRNRLLSWYVGGLNFQIEHHLFPRVCHVHYPAIAAIVERACAEHGIVYVAHETMRRAFASHFRLLARMGQPIQREGGSPATRPAESLS